MHQALTDLRGSKFFHFHAAFDKKLVSTPTLGVGAPTPSKILDPPLPVLKDKITQSTL